MKRSSLPAFEFKKHESVREGICRLFGLLGTQSRLEAAHEETRAGNGVPSDACIHAMRLILKRHRALLRLVRSHLPESVARQHHGALRRAARGLASAREASVAARTLRALQKEIRGHRAAAVAETRKRVLEVIQDRVPSPAGLARAVHQAESAIQKSATALAQRDWERHGWGVLAKGLHSSYRRARRRFRAARTTGEATSFHSWRTSVKSLMYELRVLRRAAPRKMNALLKDLDQLQEILGDEHDLAVVNNQIQRSSGSLGGRVALKPVFREIRARQQRLRKQALRAGRHLFSDAPAEFTDARHREWKAWRVD
jgi:CHAD domain-containing protein